MYDASSTNNDIVANGDVFEQHHIGTNPTIVANADFSHTESLFLNGNARLIETVVVVVEPYIFPKQAMIADGDFPHAGDAAEIIEKNIVANGELSVVFSSNAEMLSCQKIIADANRRSRQIEMDIPKAICLKIGTDVEPRSMQRFQCRQIPTQ